MSQKWGSINPLRNQGPTLVDHLPWTSQGTSWSFGGWLWTGWGQVGLGSTQLSDQAGLQLRFQGAIAGQWDPVQ